MGSGAQLHRSKNNYVDVWHSLSIPEKDKIALEVWPVQQQHLSLVRKTTL